MKWLQVSPFLSEVPWSRTAFQFLAILGHENFCHSPEDLEPSLAERPCSHWGGLATFPGHISSSSQNPHHCSHFRSGGNQFLIFCHLPWPFLSFPLEDIIRNLIKEFRFLQKSGKAFDFRPSALKKSPKRGIAKNWVTSLKLEEEEIQTGWHKLMSLKRVCQSTWALSRSWSAFKNSNDRKE